MYVDRPDLEAIRRSVRAKLVEEKIATQDEAAHAGIWLDPLDPAHTSGYIFLSHTFALQFDFTESYELAKSYQVALNGVRIGGDSRTWYDRAKAEPQPQKPQPQEPQEPKLNEEEFDRLDD